MATDDEILVHMRFLQDMGLTSGIVALREWLKEAATQPMSENLYVATLAMLVSVQPHMAAEYQAFWDAALKSISETIGVERATRLLDGYRLRG